MMLQAVQCDVMLQVAAVAMHCMTLYQRVTHPFSYPEDSNVQGFVDSIIDM
jgi:hypothetical protein